MEEKKPLSSFAISTIFVGILLFIGVVIYFGIHLYQQYKEDHTLNMNDIEQEVILSEMTYEAFESYFSSYGISKPTASFVYNVAIPENERKEVDPYYQDPYLGYLNNEDTHAALYSVEDGYYFLLYHPETGEIFSSLKWFNNVEQSLAIYQALGEKAELSLQAVEETNSTKKATILQVIEEKNKALNQMVQKLNDSLTFE